MKYIYIVQKGEKLCDIAAKFKISINALAIYNGITKVDGIKPGDCLHIPEPGGIIE